jgi:dihydrofolate reductase
LRGRLASAGARRLGPHHAVPLRRQRDRRRAPRQELAGDRTVSIAAGDVGGQIFEAGLVDEVADVVPVVFGTGKRYFGPLSKQVLLEDPDEIVQGDRVLHLRFRVCK